MLITYITCFAIYLGTQQCINFYFRGNISAFMTENNSSRFFWAPGTYRQWAPSWESAENRASKDAIRRRELVVNRT